MNSILMQQYMEKIKISNIDKQGYVWINSVVFFGESFINCIVEFSDNVKSGVYTLVATKSTSFIPPLVCTAAIYSIIRTKKTNNN